jgi:hypothetical protein
MATTNPITGDELKSKVSTNQYRDNYDLIFKKANDGREETSQTSRQNSRTEKPVD